MLPAIDLYFQSLIFKMKRNPYLRICFCVFLYLNFFAHELRSETVNPWRLNPFGHQILNSDDPGFGGLSGISFRDFTCLG